MVDKTVYEILQEELTPEEFTEVDKALMMVRIGKMITPEVSWEDVYMVISCIHLDLILGYKLTKLREIYFKYNTSAKVNSEHTKEVIEVWKFFEDYVLAVNDYNEREWKKAYWKNRHRPLP